MTLTQLKIFIMVAELGNVTKAAERLGLTQSAASAAIAGGGGDTAADDEDGLPQLLRKAGAADDWPV